MEFSTKDTRASYLMPADAAPVDAPPSAAPSSAGRSLDVFFSSDSRKSTPLLRAAAAPAPALPEFVLEGGGSVVPAAAASKKSSVVFTAFSLTLETSGPEGSSSISTSTCCSAEGVPLDGLGVQSSRRVRPPSAQTMAMQAIAGLHSPSSK